MNIHLVDSFSGVSIRPSNGFCNKAVAIRRNLFADIYPTPIVPAKLAIPSHVKRSRVRPMSHLKSVIKILLKLKMKKGPTLKRLYSRWSQSIFRNPVRETKRLR